MTIAGHHPGIGAFMSNRATCSYLTRRGRPCRNPAAPGTDPPACARHRRLAARTADDRPQTTDDVPAAVGVRATRVATSAVGSARHFYFPHPTADELAALGEDGAAADLRPEVALVRVVLRRLLALLDEGDDLPPEELRRIAGLLFTGARTVAALLGHRAARPAEAQDWLNAALEEMAAKYPGLEL